MSRSGGGGCAYIYISEFLTPRNPDLKYFPEIFPVNFSLRFRDRLTRVDRDSIEKTGNYAILIDREIASKFWVPYFLNARARDPLCHLILLVTDPEMNDWVEDEHPSVQFSAIIRNNGMKLDKRFKAHALEIVNDATNYKVVAAVDGNFTMRDEYTKAGVPFVFDEKGTLQGTMGLF